MEKKSNEELLITIILYLLLSLAFFSNFVSEKTGGEIDNRITIIFIFGILALICLYASCCLDKDLKRVGKAFGYIFSSMFFLLFGWFLFIYFIGDLGYLEGFKELIFTKSIWGALLVSLLLIYLIIKARNKKPKPI